MNCSNAAPEPPRRLQDVVSEEGFASRALASIQQVSRAADDTEIVGALEKAKRALGADHAAFASFVRDETDTESFRFLLACDPAWCIAYQRHGWYAQDPWLLYAQTHSEPVCASRIPLRTQAQRATAALAATYGVASAYIVPAPSSGSVTRLGVLMLGSRHGDYFEGEATVPIRLLARSLAMELHEWWVRRVRQEIIEQCRLTPDDMEVLVLERQGLGSKQIADRLHTSASAVDSRFQRLNAKFHMPTRACRHARRRGDPGHAARHALGRRPRHPVRRDAGRSGRVCVGSGQRGSGGLSPGGPRRGLGHPGDHVHPALGARRRGRAGLGGPLPAAVLADPRHQPAPGAPLREQRALLPAPADARRPQGARRLRRAVLREPGAASVARAHGAGAAALATGAACAAHRRTRARVPQGKGRLTAAPPNRAARSCAATASRSGASDASSIAGAAAMAWYDLRVERS